MDLWRGSLTDFVHASECDVLPSEMTKRFVQLRGHGPSAGELRSWQNSLPHLGSALRSLRGSGVGVRVARAAAVAERTGSAESEPYLATEYHLPLSGQRIDVLLCGRDALGSARAMVVELKQWSRVALEDEFSTNVVVDGDEHLHPCEQAQGYVEWLREYHGACVDEGVAIDGCSFAHNLEGAGAAALRDERFAPLLSECPLFTRTQPDALAEHVAARVSNGDGMSVLDRMTGAKFRPSPRVLQNLERVLTFEERWHLLGDQRRAYNAIRAAIERAQRTGRRTSFVVRGGPGTGKTVIAIQLLADALRRGWGAAHSTGGKEFTTALRARFRGADRLFRWNLDLRTAPYQGLDLLLVDEAHRVRATSDTRWTKTSERGLKSQTRELLDAARVVVFLLDENQFVRPDEVGSMGLLESTSRDTGTRLVTYDLATQFRCGGCAEYVEWVDALLGFNPNTPQSWGAAYRLELTASTTDLDALLDDAERKSESARLVAGFCWEWSPVKPDGALEPDVVIGEWTRPWNAKPVDKKHYPPHRHPYTLWAETDAGRAQIGCIYSAQGFEFDQVGVIWGKDLVWRNGAWVAQKEYSRDRPVRGAVNMVDLVRNAYRVLLTRGIRGTRLLCIDDETRDHIAATIPTSPPRDATALRPKGS